MEKIDMEDIYSKIENLCIKFKRNIRKGDINKKNGFEFHYNTYMNAGLRLRNFNFFEILYNSNPKSCKKCKLILDYSKRTNIYCSSSCSASENNSKREKREKNKCNFCNNKLKRSNSFFCSIKCQKKSEFIEKLKKWCLGQDIHKGKFIKRSNSIKKMVITMNGYQCERCGLSDSYNKKPIILHLEHINGDATNNKKDNVCLLCPNCHSLTPTYKGKNKGNGKRQWRKQRYHEGKSY